jgi:hypothetical protein
MLAHFYAASNSSWSAKASDREQSAQVIILFHIFLPKFELKYSYLDVSYHIFAANYNVIVDTFGLSAERLQQLTYKMTHLYYNWSGTVR